MEKQQDLTLMKVRSYRRVLADGLRLYTENFRRLFKASWIAVLLSAAALGGLATISAIKLPQLQVTILQQLNDEALTHGTARQYLLTMGAFLLLLLLVIATQALASATILGKLKEHEQTDAITTPRSWLSESATLMGRTLGGVFLTLLVAVVPFVLLLGILAAVEQVSPGSMRNHLTTVTVTVLTAGTVISLLELPLMHVLMKYIMVPKVSYWNVLRKDFVRAMRHWGQMFLVFFVSVMVVSIAAMIAMLPSNILTIANQEAHMGLLMGDPLGMPAYIGGLTFVTAMLCGFIQFYISQLTLVHNYYLYGSIETREHEKDSIH